MTVAERLGIEVYVQGMDQVIKSLQQVDTNTAKSGKSMEAMGRQGKSGFAQVADGVQSLAKSAYFIKNGLIDPVMNATTAIFEFGRSAAQGVAVRDSFDYMARGVGESSNKMIEAMRKASRGTVSDTKLMLAANVAMTLGAARNSDQLTGLLEVAQIRARRFGLTTEQAFSDISRGIGRLSPLILDNLGFTIDAARTYTAYAATIGKTSSQLSDMEKKQALVNRILADTKAEVEAARGATEQYVNTFERWDATTENFKQAMGEAVLPSLTDGIDAWMVMGEQVGTTAELLAIHTEALASAAQTGRDYTVVAREMIAAKKNAAEKDKELAAAAEEADGRLRAMIASFQGVKTAADAANASVGGFVKTTEFTGEAGVRAIQNQKDAYDELTKMPAKRAATEQQWNGIIMQIARTSSDQRIQNALLALDTENLNFKTALQTREASITTHNEWVKTEEERIKQLRIEKRWEEAGVAEQVLNHAKEGFKNDLVDREELQKAHDDRVKILSDTLWAGIKASRDDDLILAIAHKNSELGLLDERKKALMEYIRTGKMWSESWTSAWERAQKSAFATKHVDKWTDHIRSKLDKPFTIEIHGVYIPPANVPHAPGHGNVEFQHGGVVTRPTRAIIGEAGPEAVLPLSDPGRMARVLAQALSMRGVGGSNTTYSPSYNLTTQSVTRPGGLRMEFSAMAAADMLATR